MAQNNRQIDDGTPLRIRRGRVESVDLYEIKDTELDALEKGTPADLQLNFAIFLLSLAFSAIASLETATFATKSIETTFIIVAVVGILLGVYLMIAWWRARSEVKELCKRIRQRIPPDVQAPDEDEEEEPALTSSAVGEVNDEPSPKG
ncbi:MAG TPA: hypothetical protein VJ673_23170 [Aromatoleum sp.]|uniref:hypothetical protein n=1 Tax=Aromatoleum sp. TaxID=2307007 RepID=UPI002B49B0ED|nr:hypothetical protein [Aromatoleum sp.]HJV28600.1 hypothetical protein [Aromatoleum sp.]